jgi:hypothetical protein
MIEPSVSQKNDQDTIAAICVILRVEGSTEARSDTTPELPVVNRRGGYQ